MAVNKQEETRFEPVVSGGTKLKKKSSAQKFLDIFLAEDIEAVKRHIVRDIVVPGIKKGVLGAIESFFNMSDSSSGRSRSSVASSVSYRDYYDRDRSSSYRQSEYALYDFDDIIFNSYGDAQLVLAQMDDILDRFRVVRVSDMYDLSKLDWPAAATNYGWTNLSSAKVVQNRDGYSIRLPKAMPLDR